MGRGCGLDYSVRVWGGSGKEKRVLVLCRKWSVLQGALVIPANADLEMESS